MTIWIVVSVVLGMAAYAVAWFGGGRTERFAAAVMLLHFAVAAMSVIYGWERYGFPLPRLVDDYVRLLIFVWLCFRSDRWWPLVMTTALGLIAVVDVITLVDPALSYLEGASAKIGLGYLVDLTLMLSVCERMLAGEPPASRAAWARASAATAARLARARARRSGEALLRNDPARGPQDGRPRLPA